MHVTRVIQEFFPDVTGPANQVLAISQGLEKLDVRSPIFTTSLGTSENLKTVNITVHRFKPNIALPNFKPSRSLVKCLGKTQTNLFHVHSWRNPTSDSAVIIANRRHIPIIIQSHGVAYGYTYSNEPITIRVIRMLYEAAIHRLVVKSAFAVIASTKLEAKELQRYGFPLSRIVIIPVGVSRVFFRNRKNHRVNSSSISLLTIGRLGPRRNIEQIIKAIALLRTKGTYVKLRVVGPDVKLSIGDSRGYQQSLKKLAKELEVEEFISFIGPRFGNDLLFEYLNADVFLYTSLYENFGQPIAEAAAAGLPIISTPTGIAPELLGNGEAGLLVPFNNIESTADAICRLSLNPELRNRLGQKAQHRAKELFDWERIVPKYIDLYNAALKSKIT